MAAKKVGSTVFDKPNEYILNEFVSPSHDEYIAELSRQLSEVEVDPFTRELKEGESAEDQKQMREGIDMAYNKALSESTVPGGRVTSARYTAPSAGVDPEVTAIPNQEGLRRTDAATIGQDQGWARAILANPRFDGKDPFADPNLTLDEEAKYLDTFAQEMGVTPQDIAQSPSLRAAFGRYLGKATGTLNATDFYAYDLQGMERKDQNGKNYKTPTPYVEPKFIDQYTNVDNTLASKQTVGARQARTSKEAFIKNAMARGQAGQPISREAAERMYEQQGSVNFDESIIDRVTKERSDAQQRIGGVLKPNDIASVPSRMANRQYKAFEGFMRSMRNYSSSPMQATRFTEKYLGGRFSEFSPESAEELMLTFMATHSALVERRPDAARMWSDMMMLAVLDHARKNVYRYEDDKKDTEDSKVSDESTEAAIKRFDEVLMTGAADEVNIGSTIFKNMGFENASKDQKAMLGSMAMSLVFETFRNEAPYTKGNRNKHEKQLVIKRVHKSPDGRTHIGYTLTEDGLSVADDMEELFNAVMPSSVRDVRYGNKTTSQAAINKLINMPVARKKDGTYQYEGYDVPFGDTQQAREQKEQAENVPVTIHKPTSLFLNALLAQFRESEFDLQYADQIDNVLLILESPKFYNIKGDGSGFKGAFGQRPGRVYTTNRSGNLIHKDSPSLIDPDAQEITTVNKSEAHYEDDYSDQVKDASFIQTLQWAQRNEDKIFYYDYDYGKNWRLSVNQTVGNYQHNKLARALVASGKPVTYHLDNLDHVIRLKAGVMRRFGFDNMNPHQAALMYDTMIDQFAAIRNNPQAILKLASEHEGWASVTSILEALAIKDAFDSPTKMSYTSGFFTEIDGKTNGLGWSAMQAGDTNTAAGAFIFNEKDYGLWAKHYDAIEKFQSAGELDQLRDFAKHATGDEKAFDKYLDAYNKVNTQVKGKFKGIKSGEFVSYPSMIRDKADFAMKAIMKKAQDAGGPDNFRRALEIFEENNLGRAFTKKPVMIFGYGAGGARHLEQVRIFINEIIKRDGSILQKFDAEGINIDTQFIDPLGVMMSEAINMNFPVIKNFANMLSLAANEAVLQGFDLFPATMAGHRVPLGGEHWWLSQEKGDNRAFSYTHPEHRDPKTGELQTVKGVAHNMKVLWDFEKRKEYVQKKKVKDEYGQVMTVESMAETLRAATQAVVMLNHANDNINMQSGRMDRHKAIIAELKAKAKANGKPFVEDHTTVGDTSLHIFDGDLVTSMEAEATTDALNKTFQDMNSRLDTSHMQEIYKALTFDLDENGQLVRDEHADTFKNTSEYKAMNSTNREKTNFRRRLKPEGVALADTRSISTWSSELNEFAFDWDIQDEIVDKKVVKRSRSLNLMRKQNYNARLGIIKGTQGNEYRDKVTNVNQFFYSTKSLKDIIRELNGSLDYMIKKKP